MFWMKTDQGLKKGLGNEVSFQGFATRKDLKEFADRKDLKVEELLKEAGILTWIKQGNTISKGSTLSRNFTDFATEEEVKKAGGNIKEAEILNPETKNDKQNKNDK